MNSASLQVFWSLLPSPKPTWQFHSTSAYAEPIILVWERLEKIAQKILCHPAEEVLLTFTGYRPSWYPKFPQLLDLLQGAGRNIRIEIDCGIDHSLEFFHTLHNKGGRGCLLLNTYIEIPSPFFKEKLITLAELAKSELPIRVKIHGTPSEAKDIVCRFLRDMEKKESFVIDEARDISKYSQLEGCIRSDMSIEDTPFYCLDGQNFLIIDAGGRGYGAPCCLHPFPLPLWATDDPILPHFHSCSNVGCPAISEWQIPIFENTKEAAEYVEENRDSFIKKIDIPAIKFFSSSASSNSEQFDNFAFIKRDGLRSILKAIGGSVPGAGELGSYDDNFKVAYVKAAESLRQEAFSMFRAREQSQSVDQDILSEFGSSTLAMQILLADYAATYCKYNKISLGIDPSPPEPKSPPLSEVICYKHPHLKSGAKPVLSVIMPNYNKVAQIRKSIYSILAQSFTDFELLIIDDCSSDQSFDICRAYADLDSRIGLWRTPTRSMAGFCRNIGLDMAQGRYIIFVDSDDICLPGYFETALKTIMGDRADMAMFSSVINKEDGQKEWDNRLDTKELSRSQAIQAFFHGQLETAPWAKILNSRHAQIHRCRFVNRYYHQDVPFFFSFLNSSRMILTSDQTVYHYILTENSAMNPIYANTLRIDSAYNFQIFFHEAVEKSYGLEAGLENIPLQLAIYNIEKCLLPHIDAYVKAGVPHPTYGGILPTQKILFLYTLLSGYGEFLSRTSDMEIAS